VEPGLETRVLRVNLDPRRMPASLDAVRGDFRARPLRLKVMESLPDLRLGGPAGFGIVHDPQGAGPSATPRPVLMSTMAINAQRQQTRWWLRGRGHGHALHVHDVTPGDAAVLRAANGRMLATFRFAR